MRYLRWRLLRCALHSIAATIFPSRKTEKSDGTKLSLGLLTTSTSLPSSSAAGGGLAKKPIDLLFERLGTLDPLMGRGAPSSPCDLHMLKRLAKVSARDLDRENFGVMLWAKSLEKMRSERVSGRRSPRFGVNFGL